MQVLFAKEMLNPIFKHMSNGKITQGCACARHRKKLESECKEREISFELDL